MSKNCKIKKIHWYLRNDGFTDAVQSWLVLIVIVQRPRRGNKIEDSREGMR